MSARASMLKILAACLLSGASGASHGSLRASVLRGRGQQKSLTMETLAPFYHSTQSIHEQLQALAQKCPGMSLSTQDATGGDGKARSIDIVTIRGENTQPVNKVFLLFGEHARELISPESGLHFVRTLCGDTDLSERAKEILKDSEFQIVVNGNPASRELVEQGDFCKRVNPSGVDLNRNWDEKWEADASAMGSDTNPGPEPFSEPETRVFKSAVSAYKPSTFLTIHSGTRGMYMPWAFDMDHLANRNQPEMMKILKALDKDHCECPFGAAGKEVGYSCPGTCLDWVYDQLQTPYSFAFEIYTGTDFGGELKARWEEKMQASGAAYLQTNRHLAHGHFKELFEHSPSDFVQLKSQSHAHRRGFGMTSEDCFSQFNPDSSDTYNSVVENWSAAYLDMATMIAMNIKNGVSSSVNSTAS